MTKRGVCELCGFADSSYSIEENGIIMKVCKFCHDGFLERLGLAPDSDKPITDVTLTLDLDGKNDDVSDEEFENGGEVMKVAALDEAELNNVLSASAEDKKVLSDAVRKRKAHDARTAARQKIAEARMALEQGLQETEANLVKEVVLPKTDVKKIRQEKFMANKQQKNDMRSAQIHAAANQSIDDDRIKITSPEVGLVRDERPKTNLDVATAEYVGGVRFIDSFKYVFNRVVYAIFLGIIVLAVTTVLIILGSWQWGLVVLGGGIVAVTLCFLLMWYLSRCYELDRRALLLRIRQQEILFESMDTDCYRELKTKFTVLKSCAWLVSKLTILLPLIAIVACVIDRKSVV